MPLEVALLVTTFLVFFVGLTIGVFVWSARRYHRTAQVWAGWASARGFHFAPHTGLNHIFPGLGASFRVSGVSAQGVPFTFDFHDGRGGPRTRLSFSPAGVPCPFTFSVTRRSGMDALTMSLASVPPITVGDPAFDQAFIVWTTLPAALPPYLSAPRRSHLLRFEALRAGVSLMCVYGMYHTTLTAMNLVDYPDPTRRPPPEFTLHWRGAETDPAVLDLALAVMAT